jgi:hypothetical protein
MAKTPLQLLEERSPTQYNAGSNPGGTLNAPVAPVVDPVVPPPVDTNVITSNTLNGNPAPVVLPTPKDNSAQIQGILAQIKQYQDDIKLQQEADAKAKQVDPLKQAQADYLASVSGGNQNSTADYLQAEKDSGIEAKQKEVNDLTGQLNAINAEAQTAKLALAGKAGEQTTTFGNNRNVEIDRELAIKSLPIQAALASAQNNLALATQHLDKLFEIKLADAKANNEYKNKLAETIMGFATENQKQLISDKIRQEDRNYKLEDENISAQKEYAKLALEGGSSDLMSQIISLSPTSKTFKQDLSALVSQIKQDPAKELDRIYKLAQINALNAKTTPTGGTTYVAGENAVVDSWAERIQNGTAKITEIPASQAGLRNAVTVALQAMGNSLDGKPTTTELGKNALLNAKSLLAKFDARQGTGAVGKSAIFNKATIPGTERANFINDFNAVKSQLSLEAVKYLKGQGQVSDAERALLAQAATKLNLSQSEPEFKTTLQALINKLEGNVQKDYNGIVLPQDNNQTNYQGYNLPNN